MTRDEVAAIIDHTQVKAFATQKDITNLCDEAREAGFATVTVNPAWVSYCARRLINSGVGIAATIGFPLGATTAHIKLEETREAIKNGATEIDMVINIGALKSGFPDFVQKEVAAVVRAAAQAPVKAIIETGYLTDAEKIAACQLAHQAGAAFVKTSTGFGQSGATAEDVQLMRSAVGEALGIKAAGGIRTLLDLEAMVKVGATRIGTSAGLDILDSVPE